MRTFYENPWPHQRHGFKDILRWKLGFSARETSRIPEAPDQAAPLAGSNPSHIAMAPDHGWRICWLGHASFLIQGNGKSLLIDPVLSDYCSPLPLPTLKRRVAPPYLTCELPPIDAILITHTHYDHLDMPTLRKFDRSTPLFFPEGHTALLKKSGFTNITEIAWWKSTHLTDNIRITAVPAQHFTSRTPLDRNAGHWCGWVIEGADKKLWHAGDSGYCGVFSEIGEHFGGIDLAMIPIGAYQPRSIMKAMHMNPEEAVQAFLDAKCQRAIAMHWGTFKLTDEPMGEPPMLLKLATREKKLPADCFVAGSIGEIWNIS